VNSLLGRNSSSRQQLLTPVTRSEEVLSCRIPRVCQLGCWLLRAAALVTGLLRRQACNVAAGLSDPAV
jgi:hypothetical protein